MKLIPSAASFDALAGPSGTRSAPRRPGANSSNALSARAADNATTASEMLARAKTGATPKKRVRLKPESREQLLERLRNPQLSLHEASILLRVSRATVRRYADANRLACQRTPGGQRRFFLRDIENFYRQLKLKR
jgi:excisionase family DNA binding protein